MNDGWISEKTIDRFTSLLSDLNNEELLNKYEKSLASLIEPYALNDDNKDIAMTEHQILKDEMLKRMR